jgi:hypothetical protein
MWRDTERNVDQHEFRDTVARSWCEQRVVEGIEQTARTWISPWTVREATISHTDVAVLNTVAEYLGEAASGLLGRLLTDDSVSFLAAHRHTESGLEKRAAWERVWSLQRAEDRGEKVPPFDPPPKYDQKDYRDATTWRLRGKLDVPKERFIRYPGCESDEDKEPVYGWAGWNHLQQAIALATLYLTRKQGEAWGKDRLIPMLAGLDELLPWIWQWHPDPTPESGGVKPGQYIADFLSAQCQELGVTLDELRAWRPDGAKRNGAGVAKKARAPRKVKADTEEETP